MKSNITLIALNKNFKKKIAKKLASSLDMFYVDVNELMKYDLLNIQKVIKISGIDYYNKEETKTINSLSTYENILITLDNDTFFNNNNYELIKTNSLFIYLRLKFKDFITILKEERPKSNIYEKMLDEKVFNERDNVMLNLSDIVINVTIKTKNVEDKIISSILKYYKGVL